MGAKSLYLDTVKKQIEIFKANNDIKALSDLDNAKREYEMYSSGWKKANLDRTIENLSKKLKMESENYNMEYNKRKISFSDDNHNYEIICSIGAKYFRIKRIDPHGGKGVYVGLDLKEPRINKNLKGKEARAERERLTHFKMTFGKGEE